MRLPFSLRSRGSARSLVGGSSAVLGLAALLALAACDAAPVGGDSAATDAGADAPSTADATPTNDARLPGPDGTPDVLLARSDLDVVLDYGVMPDLAPLPADEGVAPDAALPRTDGPPRLRLLPSTISLREAREPVVLQVGLEGEAPAAPVQVALTAPPGVTLEPAHVTLDAERRSAVIRLSAEIDADQDDLFGRIDARAEALPAANVPFVVYDAHLTWEMVLDPAELEFIRTSNDKSRRVTVENVMNGRPVAAAEINLRGKGTLVCPRRSFTVRFASPVHLQNSPPLEDVVLIALCEDPLVLRSRVSLELLDRLGLFPAWFSYVELRYGGDTRGVYVMMERPRKAIERAFPENTRVLRRLSDAEVEIDHPDEASIADREAFLSSWFAVYALREVLQGEPLLAELQRRMMFDQYLLLLAYNSAMENGDYIDELYVYDRAAPRNRPGAEVPFYGVMAWDQDEIFRRCHNPAPLNEPLTHCAESALDRLVVREPAVRALYVAQLRRLLEGPLSAESFARVAERAAAELAVYLDRPGVRALHTPPDQPAPEAETSRQTMVDWVSHRREILWPLVEAASMPASAAP